MYNHIHTQQWEWFCLKQMVMIKTCLKTEINITPTNHGDSNITILVFCWIKRSDLNLELSWNPIISKSIRHRLLRFSKFHGSRISNIDGTGRAGPTRTQHWRHGNSTCHSRDKTPMGKHRKLLNLPSIVIYHSHGKWPIYRWFTY